MNTMTDPSFKARAVCTQIVQSIHRLRSASLFLVTGALAILAGTACKSDHIAGDYWFFGVAFVQVALSDTSGTPVANIPVDIYPTRNACAGPDSSSFAQQARSDSIGKVDVLASIAYGDSVPGCIWLHVRGAPMYRDTVIAGQSVLYVLDRTMNLDTARFDITLNRAE